MHLPTRHNETSHEATLPQARTSTVSQALDDGRLAPLIVPDRANPRRMRCWGLLKLGRLRFRRRL